MSLTSTFLAIGLAVAAIALGIGARRIMEAWWRYRGQRLIVCPGNLRPAAVRLDAAHAAATALGGAPQLRLDGCSRWPEYAGCGQQCLGQIYASPEGCRVRSILTRWYEGKCCVWCGKPVGEAYWTGCNPVVLAGGVSREWSEIPVVELPETLAIAQPVCFDCHIGHKRSQAIATQAGASSGPRVSGR